MTQQELQSLCETWTEYLQRSTGNENVRYFIREDGQLMYETEDEDFFEIKERNLVDDINDTFNDFYRRKSLLWLRCEYIERVIGMEYEGHQRVYNEICDILRHIPDYQQEAFLLGRLKDFFDDVYLRADYLLHSL